MARVDPSQMLYPTLFLRLLLILCTTVSPSYSQTDTPPSAASGIPMTSRLLIATSASPTSSDSRFATQIFTFHPDTTSPSEEMPEKTSEAQSTTIGSEQKKDSNVLNFYFVFLLIFLILIFAALYVLHKRKRKAKALSRNSGQAALARDLDGWINTRRFINGRWRGGGPNTVRRQEEGLDENGEAPPPYRPPTSIEGPPAPIDAVHQATSVAERERMQSSVAIPLRTLSRLGHALPKPPEYELSEGPRMGRGEVRRHSGSPSRSASVWSSRSYVESYIERSASVRTTRTDIRRPERSVSGRSIDTRGRLVTTAELRDNSRIP